METITIRPGSKRNGMTLTLAGGLGVVLGLVLFIGWPWMFAPGLVCFALGAVSLVLGIAKQLEPHVSLEFSAEGLRFFHRRGSLFVAWDNIQRLDQPRVTQGMEQLTLPYVGLKLKRINPLLDAISPRLATGLLSEQRPLLMTAAAQDEELQTLEAALSAEFEPLTVNDERYRGVLAMFGRRCLTLDKYLGYHLYIPVDALDQPPESFVRKLRQLWQQRVSDTEL